MPIAPKKVRQTQEERRKQSERRLLTAAAEVLVEEGFAAATFARIGERAGYSHGLVTQRFGSKQGLTAALIDFLGERMENRYSQLLRGSRQPLDELSIFVDAFFHQMSEDHLAKAYFIILAATLANKLDERKLFADYHEQIRGRFANSIRRGQADGTIDPDVDAESTALALGCTQIGVALQLLVNPGLDWQALTKSIVSGVTSTLSIKI